MAAKKKNTSRKPRGTDAGGQPIDLSNTDQLVREFQRKVMAETSQRLISMDKGYLTEDPKKDWSKVKKYGNANMKAEQLRFSRAKAQYKVASRNVSDFYKNYRGPSKSIAMPAAKAPDKLSGRTADFGTRSLLEGMKSWMRGGGLRRGSM